MNKKGKTILSISIVALVTCATVFVAFLTSKKMIYAKEINKIEDFEIIREDTKKGFKRSYVLRNFFEMPDDWIPIGDEDHPFIGYLDGGGKSISIPNIDENYILSQKGDNIYCGLFGVIGSDGIAMNLNISANIESNNNTNSLDKNICFGAIAGLNNGYITSSIVRIGKTGLDFKNSIFGGFCAINKGQIKNCLFGGSAVTTYIQNKFCYGSVTGINFGTIDLVLVSNISYIFPSTLIDVPEEVIIGNIVGKIHGGYVSNVSFDRSGPNKSGYGIDLRYRTGVNCKLGGFAGLISLQSNLSINSISVDSRFTNYDDNESSLFGLFFGECLLNSYNINVNSIVLSGNYSSHSNNESYIFGKGNEEITCTKCFCFDLTSNVHLIDSSLIQKKDFDDLTLNYIGFSNKYWIRENNFFRVKLIK